MSLDVVGTSTRFIYNPGMIITPFTGVSILDSLENSTQYDHMIVTMTLTDVYTGKPTDADGTLQSSLSIFKHTALGVYTISFVPYSVTTAAASATNDLHAINFIPAATPNTAIITINVADSFNQNTSDNNTAVVTAIPPTNFVINDQTIGKTFTVTSSGDGYNGPVAGLKTQYIVQVDNVNLSADNLNIAAVTPNVFIHSGSGTDAINVSRSNGNNILDGSTGSNFLTGGTGNDTFYLDNRNPTTPIFSTIVNFHSGDNATVWGVNPTDFTLVKLDNQGAAGFLGLDLAFTAPGRVTTSFVLAGYSSTDLTNGRLSLSYGKTPDLPDLPGSQYLTVHAN